MKKNILVRTIILVVMVIMLLSINNNVLATPFEDGLKYPAQNPDSWRPTYRTESNIKEKAGKVLGIINAVGVVCSVIVIVIIGIKYMFGSVEAKAEYKKTMIPYIIGVFLLTGATTIPNIIYKSTSFLR